MYIPIRLSSLRFANDGTVNISSAKTSLAFLFTLKQTAGGKVYIKCRGVYYYFLSFYFILFYFIYLFNFFFFFFGGGGVSMGLFVKGDVYFKNAFLKSLTTVTINNL